MKLSNAKLRAILDEEIIGHLRDTAKRVTGGNCLFADDDVNLLAGLAELAIDAGLHEGVITDRVTLFQINAAREVRAAKVDQSPAGQDAEERLDRNDESAVAASDLPNTESGKDSHGVF